MGKGLKEGLPKFRGIGGRLAPYITNIISFELIMIGGGGEGGGDMLGTHGVIVVLEEDLNIKIGPKDPFQLTGVKGERLIALGPLRQFSKKDQHACHRIFCPPKTQRVKTQEGLFDTIHQEGDVDPWIVPHPPHGLQIP